MNKLVLVVLLLAVLHKINSYPGTSMLILSALNIFAMLLQLLTSGSLNFLAKCIRSNCYHSTVLDEAGKPGIQLYVCMLIVSKKGILQKKDNHIDDKKGHLNTHGSRISNQVSSGSMIFNTSCKI